MKDVSDTLQHRIPGCRGQWQTREQVVLRSSRYGSGGLERLVYFQCSACNAFAAATPENGATVCREAIARIESKIANNA